MRLKRLVQVLKTTFFELANLEFRRYAVALALYMAFSVVPALIVVGSVSASLLHEDVTVHIVEPIKSITNNQTAQVVADAIRSSREDAGHSKLTTLVTAFVLVYAASGMFRQMKTAINFAWDVPPEVGVGVRAFLLDSLMAIALVILFGLLMIVVLLVDTVVFAGIDALDEAVPGFQLVLMIQAAGVGIMFLVMMLTFALIYRVMPDARVSWRDVWVGAAVTSLLFTVGQLLVAGYFDVADVGGLYGAATAILVLIAWVYVTSHLILLGARFTYLYAQRFGDDIMPSEKVDSRLGQSAEACAD
jgi:membrane protein